MSSLCTVSENVTQTCANLTDVITGMGDLGTQLGDFMGNLAPGLLTFLIIMGVATAIVGVIFAIIYLIKKALSKTS